MGANIISMPFTDNMVFVGIDNGLDGAIVAIDEHDNVLVSTVMPVIKGAKRREYNILEIKRCLQEIQTPALHPEPVRVALEKAQPMRDSAMTAFSIGQGYGMFQGILSALEIPYEIVSPRTWQKALLVGLSKDTKSASILYAQRKQPSWDLKATERSRKPHDGLADAYCLAVYARKQYIKH